MLKYAALNFALKIGGGAFGILAAAVASRNMSPSEYGVVATILSYCALSGGLLALGGDHFFKKYFGERSDQGIPLSLIFCIAVQVALISSLLGIGAIYLAGLDSENSHLYLMCAFLIACISWQKSCSGSLVGLGKANLDASFSSLLRPFVTVTILLSVIAGFLYSSGQLNVEIVLQAQLSGYVVGLFAGMACIVVLAKSQDGSAITKKQKSKYVGLPGYFMYLRESAPMTVVGATGLLERNIDTLMLANISGPETAGKYFIVTRMSALAMMPLQAFNATNSRRLSRLISISDKQKLTKICRKISVYSAAIVGVILLSVIALGPWLLGLFGKAYQDAWMPLAILLASWLLRSLMGPVNLVAVLSGHSNWSAKAASLSLVGNMLLNVVLIPIIGIYGAILATVVSRLARSWAISRYLRRQLGVDIGYV